MQETIVRLCHHRTAIHAKSCHFQRRPYRIAGEQLIVGRDAGKFYHPAFHDEMVDQLLCLCLCDRSVLQISLNINIEERRYTADAHRCPVLCLDRSEISKVQPLHCLMCIFRRLGNIIAVNRSHFLHLSKRTDLLCDLFPQADHFVCHRPVTTVCQIVLLLRNQIIDSVQCHSAVVADDTASSVSIRKAGNDLIVTRLLHLRRIHIKDCLIVCLMVLGKNMVQLFGRLVAVGRACLLRHLDSTIRHKCTLQRLIRLQSDDFLEFLHFFLDIASRISSQTGYDLCLHIQHTTLLALLFLKLLQFAPQLFRRVGGSYQKMLVTLIRLIIFLDKVPYIYIFFPFSSGKTGPGSLCFHSSVLRFLLRKKS